MANFPNLALPKFSADRYDPDLANTFLAQYDNYRTTYNLDDARSVSTLYSALTGNAAVWFKNLKDSEPTVTWDTVRERFEAYYTAPVPRASRAEIAAKCKQKPEEEIRTFLKRCLATANQCIPVPAAGGLVEQTITVRIDGTNHNVPFTPTVDHARVWTQVYRHETAVNLFIAGCDSATRHALLLDARWTTWDELCKEATRIQSTIHPDSVARQLRSYTGPAPHSGAHVSAVAPGAAAPPTPQLPPPPPPPGQSLAPVTGGKTHRGSSSKKKSRGPSTGGRSDSNKPPPHPQQQKTHQHPVQCYYCTGTHHTERHCLAKQQAAGTVGAVQQPAQPPPPPALTPAHTGTLMDGPGNPQQPPPELYYHQAPAYF